MIRNTRKKLCSYLKHSSLASLLRNQMGNHCEKSEKHLNSQHIQEAIDKLIEPSGTSNVASYNSDLTNFNEKLADFQLKSNNDTECEKQSRLNDEEDDSSGSRYANNRSDSDFFENVVLNSDWNDLVMNSTSNQSKKSQRKSNNADLGLTFAGASSSSSIQQSTNRRSNRNDNGIKLYLDQNMRDILSKGIPFQDEHFPPGLEIITTNPKSYVGTKLIRALLFSETTDLKELDNKIIWMRCQVNNRFLLFIFFTHYFLTAKTQV